MAKKEKEVTVEKNEEKEANTINDTGNVKVEEK